MALRSNFPKLYFEGALPMLGAKGKAAMGTKVQGKPPKAKSKGKKKTKRPVMY